MRRNVFLLSTAIFLSLTAATTLFAQEKSPARTKNRKHSEKPVTDQNQPVTALPEVTILPEQGASQVGPEDQQTNPNDKVQNFGSFN
jgi:hypothetical protein